MATVIIPAINPEIHEVPALPTGGKLLAASTEYTFTRPVSVQVVTDGDLVVTPFNGDENGAATAITISAAPVGFVPIFRVVKVGSATSAVCVVGF